MVTMEIRMDRIMLAEILTKLSEEALLKAEAAYIRSQQTQAGQKALALSEKDTQLARSQAFGEAAKLALRKDK